MRTAAAGLFLVFLMFLLFLMVFSSYVEVSLEYGGGRLNLVVSVLWGLVRRCLALGRKEEGAGEQLKEAGLLRRILAAGWRFRRTGLYLSKKTRLEELDVDLVIGLGRADLTAWSVGSAWALAGSGTAVLSRLVAPGSVRPRLRVAPCFGKQRFNLFVRGRVKVRIFHLLAAGWLAWRTGAQNREPEKVHKFRVPGHIKVCRKELPKNSR